MNYLYSRLQNLPRSGSSLAQVESTCVAVEKLLRQSEAQGEVVSNSENVDSADNLQISD